MIRVSIFLAVLCASLIAATSYAHKVNVFAYPQGDEIIGESSFSGGRKAQNVEVVVQDRATGSRLLSTRTDENGKFTFPIPDEARQARMDLRIILQAGDAHRNEWLLEAADYLNDITTERAGPEIKNKPYDLPTTEHGEADRGIGADEQLIRQIVEESVARQMEPIRDLIAEQMSKGPTLKDILGGIGYIFGFAGILAYIRSRKRNGR